MTALLLTTAMQAQQSKSVEKKCAQTEQSDTAIFMNKYRAFAKYVETPYLCIKPQ